MACFRCVWEGTWAGAHCLVMVEFIHFYQRCCQHKWCWFFIIYAPPPPFRNIWTVIYIILSTPVPIAPAIVIIQRWHSAVSQNFSLFWSLWNRKNVPNQPVEGTRNYCHFSPASYVDLPESLSSTAAQKSTMGRCFRGFAQFVPRWFSYFWWPTPLQ